MTIRYVMVGGGPGALIGEAHRIAARAAGFELVAGAFASTAEKSQAQAVKSGLGAERGRGDWQSLIADAETLGARAIVIVTPNHLHAPIAIAALRAGLHVICDKPLCLSADEAEAISGAAQAANRIVGITYTYAGYASLEEAARRIGAGEIGAVRLIVTQFIQDWLAAPSSAADPERAVWRMDPARSGPSGAVADIGTHIFHMAGLVSGLQPRALSAELTSFVNGRRLDDTGLIHLRYATGARGVLTVTQAAAASGGGLRFEILGEAGGFAWDLQRPHDLTVLRLGAPAETVTIPTPGLLPEVPGAPAGFLNAFAALYGRFAAAISGHSAAYPGIAEGVAGMRFIEAAVRSSQQDGSWTTL